VVVPKIYCFYCFGCRVFTEVSWALINRDHVLRLAEINRRIIGATSQYRLSASARTISRKDTIIKTKKATSTIAARTNVSLPDRRPSTGRPPQIGFTSDADPSSSCHRDRTSRGSEGRWALHAPSSTRCCCSHTAAAIQGSSRSPSGLVR
jgi:ribosomal protein L44E